MMGLVSSIVRYRYEEEGLGSISRDQLLINACNHGFQFLPTHTSYISLKES